MKHVRVIASQDQIILNILFKKIGTDKCLCQIGWAVWAGWREQRMFEQQNTGCRAFLNENFINKLFKKFQNKIFSTKKKFFGRNLLRCVENLVYRVQVILSLYLNRLDHYTTFFYYIHSYTYLWASIHFFIIHLPFIYFITNDYDLINKDNLLVKLMLIYWNWRIRHGIIFYKKDSKDIYIY